VMMPAAAIFAQLRWFSLGHRQPSSHAQLQESYRRLSSGEYVGQPQPRNRHCNAHPAAPGQGLRPRRLCPRSSALRLCRPGDPPPAPRPSAVEAPRTFSFYRGCMTRSRNREGNPT
jgi:hypothetical protein